MTTPPNSTPRVSGPPSTHQLALMIWLAVFPTLLALNLILGDWLRGRASPGRSKPVTRSN